MSIGRISSLVLLALAIGAGATLLPTSSAEASTRYRHHTVRMIRPGVPVAYCWTERQRVLVHTRWGWRWQIRRIRACR